MPAFTRHRPGAVIQALAAYVVYVGFDEIGDKNEKKQTSTTKKQAARQQQMSHGL
jgi:hypothetical protein